MIRLENVVDIRTGKFHSVVIVKQNLARWFIPANESEPEEEE